MPYLNLPRKKRTNQNKRIDLTDVYNSTRWRKLRTIKIANDPLCEVCLSKDIITAAEQVHHIHRFSDSTTEDEKISLAFDYDNLMSICSKCHTEIHAKERSK